MNNYSNSSFNQAFSHIYVEREAMQYSAASKILERLSGHRPSVIPIERYMDVFCRGHQSFSFQKNAPSLILAVKHGNLIYPGAPVCQSFGNSHFYYTSFALNCPFDCEYCYLQGMYSCAHLVLFVNLESYFEELEQILAKHPVYLCISYDTDLLAMDKISGFLSQYLAFAATQPNLLTELRTKSAASISNDTAYSKELRSRIIHAYSLSPSEVIAKYEHRTAALSARLQAMKRASANGYPVRLCFDPLLWIPDFEAVYGHFLTEVKQALSDTEILDASVGTFRISDSYLKQMRSARPNSALLQFPYENDNHICHYGRRSEEMMDFVVRQLTDWIPAEKIFKTAF